MWVISKSFDLSLPMNWLALGGPHKANHTLLRWACAHLKSHTHTHIYVHTYQFYKMPLFKNVSLQCGVPHTIQSFHTHTHCSTVPDIFTSDFIMKMFGLHPNLEMWHSVRAHGLEHSLVCSSLDDLSFSDDGLINSSCFYLWLDMRFGMWDFLNWNVLAALSEVSIWFSIWQVCQYYY